MYIFQASKKSMILSKLIKLNGVVKLYVISIIITDKYSNLINLNLKNYNINNK